MEAKDQLIVSLKKQDRNSPWLMTTVNDNGISFNFTIGTGGKVAAGPRIKLLLEYIDSLPKNYPFNYGMSLVADRTNRFIILNFLGDEIAYTEVSLKTLSFIKEDFRNRPLITPNTNIEIDTDIKITETDNSSLFKARRMVKAVESETEYTVKSINKFWIFLNGSTVKVLDGDTITGNVLGYGWPDGINIPENIGKTKIGIGKNVSVRFLGVDAFETKKKDNNTYSQKQNADAASRYGVDYNYIYDSADEAKFLNESVLKNKKIIGVSLQWDTVNGEILYDTNYERLTGLVFATNYSDLKEAEYAASDGKFKGLNVNKEVLKQPFSKAGEAKEKYPKSFIIPLAEYLDARRFANNPAITTANWTEELGLGKTPNYGDVIKQNDDKFKDEEELLAEAEKEQNENKKDKNKDKNKKEETYVDLSVDGFIDNTTDYVVPFDDRLASGELYNIKSTTEIDMPFDYKNKVRIGDVMLEIPPLSIRMSRQSLNEKVKVMRSKSSLQKQVGSSRVFLTMDLYLHNLESINGYEVNAYLDSKNRKVTYAMDGLRPLIAQFKKAPFLPIDNEYINESLDIHNVALRNIEVSTVPDFPESLRATITLEKFNATPYLMVDEKLGDILNYPLLRWYYQDLLREPSIDEPWKDHLPKVDYLSNQFSFNISDERELADRNSLISEFRKMKTPNEQKKEMVDKNTEAGKLYEDSLRAKEVLDMYEKYMKLYGNGKYDKKLHIPMSLMSSYTFGANKQMKEFEKESVNNAIKVYGENPKNKGFAISIPLVKKRMVTGKESNLFVSGGLHTTKKSFTAYDLLKSDFSKNTYDGKHITEYSNDKDFKGIAQIAFTSPENKKLFSQFETNIKRKDGSVICLIPMGDAGTGKKAFFANLKKIANYKEKEDKKLNNYKSKYNFIANKINENESEVKLMEWNIDDMIPIDLNISMENVFSSAQVQQAETPTMQYFGGQDPTVQLVFETSSKGVADTEALMSKVAEYVRLYRESLVSGFISINNPLLNMFGIRYVLPENVTYETVPNFPDRKMVTMVLSAFDKTQRRQEALYGFTGGNPSESLKNRAFGSYRPEKDNIFIQERMRNQELYPDLQLPRVEELEHFLKNSKIETMIDKWENRTQQIYLDPDFYFSSKYTYRKALKNIIDDEDGVTFQWEDASGLVGKTSTKDSGPIILTDSKEENLKEEVENQKDNIDPEFNWKNDIYGMYGGEDSEENDSESANQTATKVLPIPEIKDAGVKKYFSKDKEGNYPYTKVPSYNNWKKWPGNTNKTMSNYSKWKDTLKETDEAAVWQYLAKAIANNFPDLGYAKDELEMISKFEVPISGKLESEYLKHNKKILGKHSISSAEFVYSCIYELLKDEGGFDELQNGKEPQKEAKNPKELKKVKWGAGLPKYPFQRVMGYMKAIITVESNWQHFDSNKIPKATNRNKNNNFTRVGIMGIDVTGIYDVSLVEQITWGWKRNIDYAIKEMAYIYKKASNSKYLEIKARALDWAIASHSGVEMPSVLIDSKNPKEDEDYLENKISPTSLGYYNNINKNFYFNYDTYTKDQSGFLYISGNGRVIPKVRKMYTAASLSEIGKLSGSNPMGGVNITNHLDDKNKSDETDDEVQERIVNNLLVNSWDTEKQYKSMFTDMLQHDHKGRMLRAFPSFSMYIIDEGKFFNKFNIWDNFYGYNAISSIDIYKSRKIVADTAIIEMSNMYSGISTKRKDMEFEDLVYPSFFSNVFWSQYVLNKPVEEILDAKKDIYKSMFLETGARVHIRMGYGSDNRYLPTVFNGTITEMNTGDVVQLVCQGDGLELTNIISGDTEDTNKSMLSVIEPSDFIGKLMTSKGSWIKDYINQASDGAFFQTNPNGIIHFGSPFVSPSGTVGDIMNKDFGEATQNVYSQNGTGAMTQWKTAKGEEVGLIEGLANWNSLNPFSDRGINFSNLTAENDEDNILVNLYNQTVWDIVSTFTYSTNDYVAAVVPFEMRSSLFFGKPNWPYMWKYDSEYVSDKATGNWQRNVTNAHKKTFMQAHIYDSYSSIINNNITASEEGVYTNVIVTYDGNVAPIVQADNDIRLDKQKTATVEANLIARSGPKSGALKVFGKNFHTVEAQAQRYGHATVRDFMKDMYKGEYIVLGDPTVKPHDVCYINDSLIDMQGIHLVKAVQHSMNLETGYITIIEPDAYVTNFSYEMLFFADKIFATGKSLGATAIQLSFVAGSTYMLSSPVTKLLSKVMKDATGIYQTVAGSNVLKNINEKMITAYYGKLGSYSSSLDIANLAKEFTSAKGFQAKGKILEAISDSIKITRDNVKSAKNIAKDAKSLKAKGLIADEMLKSADDIAIDIAKAYKTGKVASVGATGMKTSGKLVQLGKNVGGAILKIHPLEILIGLTLEVATSGLGEMWLRKKQDSECVKIFPLKYKGQNFTAGINGHRGAVHGDSPSYMTRMMDSHFKGGDEEIDKNKLSFFFKVLNFLTGQ